MAGDPHLALRRVLEAAVLEGRGITDPALRRAAAAGGALPSELAAYVEKVREHAYATTDAEVTALLSRSSEDAVFEVTASAALGAALERLTAGLRALEEADATEDA